ncbi:Cytochrome P450 [Amycolatopsis arida]|uniref:Cytochrome P450 n=1 Tax=Amycolatopsis arida TaxID=587909 RepID=A0A1I5P217_9PSEU|nr:cytochrome P450 [Amycolatopsis arida]TDX98325.1 cytochrome P450 [Amycolatopsis arida]SFP28037.1 Cytochrome P450 [Amycolatopsis arida]
MTAVAEPAAIPQVPGRLPLIGHAYSMWKNPLEFFQKASAQGPIVKLWLGPKLAYLVSDHEMLYDILVRKAKSFDKGMQFDRARPLLGNGILLSEGDFHRRQRRIMQPAFHHTNIASYLDIMRSAAEDVFGGWEDGQQVTMYNMFYELAVRIVIKALFSTDMAEQDIAEVYRSMPTVISGVERRAAIPPALLDLVPTRSSKEFHAAVARLRAIGTRIVADYRARDIKPSNDLMALLFTSRDEGNELMTDKQIHEEFMTLLTAGSETTPSAMGWTCYLLGKHPDVQERIQAEVDEVFPDGVVTAKGLPKLEYTRRVVHESLRLYPPVWALGRRTAEEVEIGGHLLPARTQVFYSIHAIHHDPKVYDDPERFDPDRWKGERAKQVPRSAFTPFGAGVRNCIGESFAWTEIQAVLATMLARWTLRPVSNAPVPPVAMGALVPGPLPMTVVKRTR